MFTMDDRHSVEAFRQEFINLFGTTNKEKLRKMFDSWYDYISTHKYNFLCMSSDPPKMTLNFNKQLYPPNDKKPTLDLESPPKQSMKGAGLKSRSMRLKIAVDLGLPKYRANGLSNAALEEYIKVKSADAQHKIGNDNPKIINILEDNKVTGGTLSMRFYRNINKYKKTNNNDYLDKLKITINSLINNGIMSKDEVIYKISKAGLDQHFKFT